MFSTTNAPSIGSIRWCIISKVSMGALSPMQVVHTAGAQSPRPRREKPQKTVVPQAGTTNPFSGTICSFEDVRGRPDTGRNLEYSVLYTACQFRADKIERET